MEETLLSWAIARNSAVMSNQQLAEYIFEKSEVYVDPHDIWEWRNGYNYPRERVLQNALARTFGYCKYSQLLIPDDHVAMSVMIVGEDLDISADQLRAIWLNKTVEHELAEHMRLSIDITGNEVSAIGVAVEFWARYIARPHPIVGIKLRLNNSKEKVEIDGK